MSVLPAPVTNVKVCVAPASGSVAESVPTVAFAALFSARLLADSAMSVGASFTDVTVMVKVLDALVSTLPSAMPPLSWTAIVTVAEPFALLAGVKVRVPLAATAG